MDPKVLESAVSRKDNSIRLPRYDDEIRLLECRLGVIDGDGDEVSHSRKKLRKELEDDGFDADLQDFLDGVLVRFGAISGFPMVQSLRCQTVCAKIVVVCILNIFTSRLVHIPRIPDASCATYRKSLRGQRFEQDPHVERIHWVFSSP